jgi:hypothetical protein
MIGYEIVEQPRIARTRSDQAVVLNAYSPGLLGRSGNKYSGDALALALLAAGVVAAHAQSENLRNRILSATSPEVTWPEFQPVWNVDRWACTGLELYVVDDNDACHQLDVLAEGLGCPRTRLSIKPRVGWQGYGHPDVCALG